MIEDELNRLIDSSLTEREKDDVIAQAASKLSDLCVKIARRHAKYPGIIWGRDADDLVQLVQEQALLKLRKIATEGSHTGVNFEVQLNSSARGAIRDYADSGQNTMIARGGAAHRRARIEFVQREMDVRVAEERKKPDESASVLFDNDVEQICASDASGHLEMQNTIERTIAECARMNEPILYAVAIEMFSGFPDGGTPSVADVSRRLHIPYTTAQRRFQEVANLFEREIASGLVD